MLVDMLMEELEVGDKVTHISYNGRVPSFNACKIRHIYKKSVHLSWVGDDSYYGKVDTVIIKEKQFCKYLITEKNFDEIMVPFLLELHEKGLTESQ